MKALGLNYYLKDTKNYFSTTASTISNEVKMEGYANLNSLGIDAEAELIKRLNEEILKEAEISRHKINEPNRIIYKIDVTKLEQSKRKNKNTIKDFLRKIKEKL